MQKKKIVKKSSKKRGLRFQPFSIELSLMCLRRFGIFVSSGFLIFGRVVLFAGGFRLLRATTSTTAGGLNSQNKLNE